MIFLYFFLFLLIVLLLIPLFRLHVIIEYYEEFILYIKIFGIKFKVFPNPKTIKIKKNNNKENKIKVKSNNKLKSKYNGFNGFISMVKDIYKIGFKSIRIIFQKIEIQSLRLNVSLVGDDSAHTALLYGQACSLIYPLISILVSNKDCSDLIVDIHPDFTGSKNNVRFHLHLYSRLFDIINSIRLLMQEYSNIK